MDDLEIGDLDVAHPYDSRAALDTTFFFNGGGNVWRQSDDSLGVLAQGRGQRRDVFTGRRSIILVAC
jgi:hypothetical protein